MPHAAALQWTMIFFSQYKYDYTLRYPLIRTFITSLYVVIALDAGSLPSVSPLSF